MDKLSLQAEERTTLGKKVKKLRKDGKLPAHVYGKGIDSESVSVDVKTFLKIFKEAGETGVVYLKVGAEKVRPVLVRGVQFDPISNAPVHIDFYQVNLTEKVKAPIPLTLIGEDPESVKMGEAIVLQTLNELEVEALPTDLIEKIEVDISSLKNIDDAITVGQLQVDRSKLTIDAADEDIIVKLAPAVTAEMEKLMEEQAAEAAAAAAEAGAQAAEGEVPASAEATAGKPAEGAEGVVEGEQAVVSEEPAPEGEKKEPDKEEATS